MKVHILTDNKARKRGFLAEHGLSIYIEYENTKVLFDTGQSKVFCYNAERMGLNIKEADAIILSHGHYDHCGGLPCFPSSNLPNIYVHPDAFAKRYSVNSDGKSYREVGIPWSLDDYKSIKSKIIFNRKEMEISPGITLCAEIPFSTDFETGPEGFYIGNETNKSEDLIKDEQMLIFDTDKGLSIFLGCSHPGIVNCLKYALKRFPNKNIYSVAAGMHLKNVSPVCLKKTKQFLTKLEIQKIIPLHCTGIFAISEMKQLFGNKCHVMFAGDSLEF